MDCTYMCICTFLMTFIVHKSTEGGGWEGGGGGRQLGGRRKEKQIKATTS